MATIRIKTSELGKMIRESVRKVISESHGNNPNADISMEQLEEMVEETVSEAFGEKGDHNGAHVGGTFGDAGKKKDPLSEARKKKGLPPWLKGKGFSKGKKADDDKKEDKEPAKKKAPAKKAK